MNRTPISRCLLVLSIGLAGFGMTAVAASGASEEGTVVARDEMPEFCQNAAAEKYETGLENITTNNPESRDFGTLIVGSVDGDTNTFYFDCRFDKSDAYMGIITQ